MVAIYPSDNAQKLKDRLRNKNNKAMTGEKMKKKGFSQRGLGSYVPAHLNESPFFEDSIHKKSEKVNTSEENLSKILNRREVLSDTAPIQEQMQMAKADLYIT